MNDVIGCHCKTPRVTYSQSRGQAVRKCECCKQANALDLTYGARRTLKTAEQIKAFWTAVDAN